MPGRTRTVSKTVIIALTTVTTLALVALGSLEYLLQRQERFAQFHDELALAAEQLALSLALPLWNLEYDQAAKIVDSAMRDRTVHGVTVTAAESTRTVAGRARDENGDPVPGQVVADSPELFSKQSAIVYNGTLLGQVQVTASTRFVTAALRLFAIRFGLSILAVNVALVWLLYAVLNRRVARPLQAVEAYALAVSAGRPEATLPPDAGAPTELENLRTAIARMVEDLRARYEQLECSQRALALAEERYRNIFENALAGIFQTTDDGRFLAANPAMARILGYDSPQALMAAVTDIGRQVFAEPGVREALLARARRQGMVTAFLFRFRRSDGEERWGELQVRQVADAAGEHLHNEGMLEDVTDRKQAADDLAAMARGLEQAVAERTADLARKAQELEATNLRLRELDAAKSAFLSSVSHELRTPMTSVLGFTKLIRKDFAKYFAVLANSEPTLQPRSQRVRENLRIIEHEAERLTRLINDVLDLAKIESGRVQWQECVFAPEVLIRRATEALSGQFAQTRQVVLRTRLAADLPCVKGDLDRLEQVLINLLGNALKFTRSGTVEITADADESGSLRIRVRDTGPGIPEGELENIFNKFHQVARMDGAEHKSQGTGLGLTICRQIVEHHGGRIWAESRLGQGSVFTCLLPALSPPPDGQDGPAPAGAGFPTAASSDGETTSGRPLVLVVDDDPAVRSYLSQLLASQGYEVVTAGDGTEAIEAARKRRPDCITMDIMMPGMDGETAISLLRRDPRLSRIPILVLTVREGFASNAADATLTKPVDEDKLLDLLRSLLGRGTSNQPILLLAPWEGPDLASLFSFAAKDIARCDVAEMWARIEAGFHGTVVLPSWALRRIDMERLVAQRRIRVLLLPESEDTAAV